MFTGFFKTEATRKRKKPVVTKGYVQLGDDGLYFEGLDNAYLNSPTATMCLLKFLEYCIPPGLKAQYIPLWNKIKNDYIRYGYYILNIEYDVNGNVRGFLYKNPKDFLIKDKDDNGNASTFINIKTGVVYPAFNSTKAVVLSQFTDQKGGYRKFLGQIYMYNDTSQPYRITPLYSVKKWMEAEDDSATYTAKASDNAMFGNNLFVAKKSSDPTAKELEILGEIKSAISGAKGVENTAQNLLLEYQGDIEDVTKLISKVSISNDVDVDLLNATDDKAESKICVACYNFPKILLFQGEGIFGDSGVAIQTATDLWQETCLREANHILEGFAEIGIAITDKIVEVPEEVDSKTQDAQAVLRGSVGGAQMILTVQQSFAAQTTSFESAISIFELIYGFTREEAIKLLGNPKIEPNANSTTDPNAPAA